MASALYCILDGMSGGDNKGGTFLIQAVSLAFLIYSTSILSYFYFSSTTCIYLTALFIISFVCFK